MDEPLLVAASELKDAIENVFLWRKALIKYLKEEREYVKDKVSLNGLITWLETGSPLGYKSYVEAFEYLEDVADEVVTFAKEEGYK